MTFWKKDKPPPPDQDPLSIGNLLVAAGFATEDDIRVAVEFKKRHPDVLMGHYLVSKKIITEKQLEEVIAKQLAQRHGNSAIVAYAQLARQRVEETQNVTDSALQLAAEKVK